LIRDGERWNKVRGSNKMLTKKKINLMNAIIEREQKSKIIKISKGEESMKQRKSNKIEKRSFFRK
jgi:hypothetical protein